MQDYDVAIVGSGPSGASTAFYLAQQGIKTIIIEKETLPRYKTCGGGFSFKGRRNLPIDVSSVVELEFKSIDLYLAHKQHYTSTRKNPIVSLVMRDVFDELIVAKAKELGVVIEESCLVTSIIQTNSGAVLHNSKEPIRAKYVIAADGAFSGVAKMAGWKEDTRLMIPALEYEIEVGEGDYERLSKEIRFDVDGVPSGYGWCFPKKQHLSIGVCVFKKKSPNIKELCQKYIEYLGITDIKSIQKHGSQIPVSPRTDGFVKNNVFLIGDAAGFTDPITAEGISNAIYSGKIVAEAIASANGDVKSAADIYETKIQETLLPQLQVASKVAKFLYQKKTLRNIVMKKYGQQFTDALTDICMGDRTYPLDINEKLKKKIKEFVF